MVVISLTPSHVVVIVLFRLLSKPNNPIGKLNQFSVPSSSSSIWTSFLSSFHPLIEAKWCVLVIYCLKFPMTCPVNIYGPSKHILPFLGGQSYSSLHPARFLGHEVFINTYYIISLDDPRREASRTFFYMCHICRSSVEVWKMFFYFLLFCIELV